MSNLLSSDLPARCIPLQRASLDKSHRVLPRDFSPRGRGRPFLPGIVLLRFKTHSHVSAVQVPASQEIDAIGILKDRPDVAFAELNYLQERQHIPNDPLYQAQWHHNRIRSSDAWSYTLGTQRIQIAIVDTPFQMDHADLAAHVVSGWDAVTDRPVTSSSSPILHSTAGAGIAAAVINNNLGVAGAANCQILPININGFIDEMYNAVLWAADRGVRIVNISWDGVDSFTLNEAGHYLKREVQGLLFMAGLNGASDLDYPNHPHIIGISMTDAADNARSSHGPHIDLAAPGFDVYSTAPGSDYAAVRGTSYATPLAAGAAALLLSIHPALTADEVLALLQETAVDLGDPGWDPFFGSGRLDLGKAAAAAASLLPVIRIEHWTLSPDAFRISLPPLPNYSLQLWKRPTLTSTQSVPVTNAIRTTSGNLLHFTDPNPTPGHGFYQILATPD